MKINRTITFAFLIFATTLASSLSAAAQDDAVSTAFPSQVPVDASSTNATIQESSPESEITAGKAAQNAGYVRPDANVRFRRFVNGTVGPFALMGNAMGASISTASNSPEEWERSGKGFGKRFASNFGRSLIRNTVTYGLDETLRLDSYFYRSENRSTGAKVRNSLLSVVTARRPNGKRTVGVPRLVGTYAGHITAAEVWFPQRFTWKDGVRSGTISLGIGAGFNLFREFVLNR